jgi:Zn-dependent M28 family amino/carboxypeptidase
MTLRSLAALTAMLLAGGASAQTFSPERVRADVAFLADDLLEGRGTGTRGYDLAARFVATRFEALGLTPGGKDGWYQEIAFVTAVPDPARQSAVTLNGVRYEHGGHAIMSPTVVAAAIDEIAPAVFVGYGLEDKQYGLDDYGGLDVKGKIVVLLRGTPEGLPSDIAATLNEKKNELAVAKGAIGVVTIATEATLKVFPWQKILANSGLARMRYLHPDGHVEDVSGPLKLSAFVDPSAAEQLFRGTKLEGNVAALLSDRKSRPKGFALPTPIRVERFSKVDRVRSANVIGVLEGSDPALRDEVVMLSAHLDHLGILTSGNDRIANGAMDNAAGVATMIEAARAFIETGKRPRRSIALVALTGEEKGLFGSEYLAKYPLPAGRKLVANVNLDMPILTYDFTDVIAYGAEHSTIGEAVGRAANAMSIRLSPDPAPEQNTFVRSDHYNFVKQGVPSVFLGTGFANGGDKAVKTFEDEHYHTASDDLALPIDWSAAAKFARLNYLIASELADAAASPRWYANDYFGDKFAPNAPKAARP